MGAVFLGLCVYNDALSRQNPNAGMWGVLCGFFGAIVALIYLIIVTTSKNQPPRCVRCGSFLPPPVPGGPAGPVCPVCGLPAAVLPAEQMAACRRPFSLRNKCGCTPAGGGGI